jgi:hypothetical protein
VSQARAALKRYKDVMQAAERIFDGQFDDVGDEDADVYQTATARDPSHLMRIAVSYVFSCILSTVSDVKRRPTTTTMMSRLPTMKMTVSLSSVVYLSACFVFSTATLRGMVDEFIDYDSDYGVKPDSDRVMTDADPYAGSGHIPLPLFEI